MLRAFLSRIAWALAGLGASRAATLPSSPVASVEAVDSVRDTHVIESLDVVLRPAFHPELHARYLGPVTGLGDQLSWMSGKKLRNACLGGAVEEFDQFVSARSVGVD
jgi:hypothetical protein